MILREWAILLIYLIQLHYVWIIHWFITVEQHKIKNKQFHQGGAQGYQRGEDWGEQREKESRKV